jgi:phosphopantothenoylcysteine decarboxylase/phosphopantothenate--cysteine ligase
MRLSGKRIILGVTGSISAYKAAFLLRLLKAECADVQVVLTDSAEGFITPLTFSVLSGRPVLKRMVSENQTWNNHVELGLWADLLLVAPCSAHSIAAFAGGTCENLLQAVFLSARCQVMIAPAMDHDMYLHPATQDNLETLKKRGVQIIDPVKGALASGLIGEGRLPEPQDIMLKVLSFFENRGALKGKKVMVTAGPTREPIDPVRFITNHSTGKMGVALAENLRDKGAQVVFISGPLQVAYPYGVELVKVETAAEMLDAVKAHFPSCHAAIMAAAVSDYKPDSVSSQKLKKTEASLQLSLAKTEDISEWVGQQKKTGQITVGFALETENECVNALSKLQRKNLDFIVLNSLNDAGAGFGTDTNKVTLLFSGNNSLQLPLLSKRDVAKKIVESLVNLMHA